MHDNKIKELQYKILYRIVPTYRLLYKMEKVDSPRCMICNLYEETLEHMFFKCLEIRSLWLYVEEICKQIIEEDIFFQVNFNP